MSAADDFREAERQNAVIQDAYADAFKAYIERVCAAHEAVRANAEMHASFERSLRALVERQEDPDAKRR